MRPNVLIYATDVNRSREWYERLGFRLRRVNRNGGWAELEWGNFLLYLHGTRTPRPAGFALPGFEAQEGLEAVAERLVASGMLTDPVILDEGSLPGPEAPRPRRLRTRHRGARAGAVCLSPGPASAPSSS